MKKKKLLKKAGLTKGTNVVYSDKCLGCNLEFDTTKLSKKDLKALVRVIKMLDLNIIPF